MNPPSDGGSEYDQARARAEDELRRARRSGEVAARHELLATTGSEAMQPFHARMAKLHRKNESLHLAATKIHSYYADRLLNVRGGRGREAPIPASFMLAVAETSGAGRATVTLYSEDQTEALVAASDTVARAAHDLEFTLGEGPARDSMAAMATITAPTGELERRWPQYGPALTELGVRAVAAAPLRLSSVCIGALTVFDPRTEEGREPDKDLTMIADALTQGVLLSPRNGPFGEDFTDLPLFREGDDLAVLHEAAGMVSAQAGCGIDDALALIRARALTRDETPETIAREVLDRRLRLD